MRNNEAQKKIDLLEKTVDRLRQENDAYLCRELSMRKKIEELSARIGDGSDPSARDLLWEMRDFRDKLDARLRDVLCSVDVNDRRTAMIENYCMQVLPALVRAVCEIREAAIDVMPGIYRRMEIETEKLLGGEKDLRANRGGK